MTLMEGFANGQDEFYVTAHNAGAVIRLLCKYPTMPSMAYAKLQILELGGHGAEYITLSHSKEVEDLAEALEAMARRLRQLMAGEVVG